MGPITHPALYGKNVAGIYRRVFHEIARVAPTLIFASESSRSEYERLYGNAYCFAKVIYPGLRFEVAEGESEPVPGVQVPFLLTVGSLGARKNHVRALQAFERSGLVEKGYSFVMSGGQEPGYDEVRSEALGKEWARMTGYVSDSQLRWLYSQAAGFVLPSLLEGFGIPAAEAALRGLVPLVSRGGALHEVTGDSAVLVEATDVDSIAAGMKALVSLSTEEKSERLSNIREHLSFFTPEQARQGWKAAILRQSA
jgi:glycosyltransferase involved in cell wall biosynthesis